MIYSKRGPHHSPLNNSFSWLQSVCNISLSSFLCPQGFQNSYLHLHSHDGSNGPDLLVTKFQKAQPQPQRNLLAFAHTGSHISALLLVYRTAFPVALLYPQSLYCHQLLFWVGWDFSPQNGVRSTCTESGTLRNKTNNAVPSALMSLSLFLLFWKWNALAPNSSQCWLGRAPLPVFWAH